MESGKNKIIGIPKSLMYFIDDFDWKLFFNRLGYEVVYSEDSNYNILRKGFVYSVNDQCLPIKLLYGAVIDLNEKDVDFIFIPQIVSMGDDTYSCPHIMSAPFVMKSIPKENLKKIIYFEVDYSNIFFMMLKYIFFAFSLSKNLFRVVNALLVFTKYIFVKNNKNEISIPENSIGVLGHPYVLKDKFLHNDIFKKIKDHGFDSFTSDDCKIDLKEKYFDTRLLHWYVGRQIVLSADRFMHDENIKGIIYINYFGCGMDAFIEEIFKHEISDRKPYLLLSLDEHTAEAGIITRLEAFFDMIKRKNRGECSL